jgi:hypothetical protein
MIMDYALRALHIIARHIVNIHHMYCCANREATLCKPREYTWKKKTTLDAR